MQRKAAIKSEAVKRAAESDALRRQIVLSLIEESAGLLSGAWMDDEAQAVLLHFDFRRRFAMDNTGAKFELFQLPHPGVIEFIDRARLKLCHQQFDQLRLNSIASL